MLVMKTFHFDNILTEVVCFEGKKVTSTNSSIERYKWRCSICFFIQ